MTLSFASISIHSFVKDVGAYVGLASILAVAVLVLLYFAHARETATLRDRLDEAQQRIGGLEARIGQLMQLQQRGRPGGPAAAPAPVAAPVGVRPAGAPQGSVRRLPNPAAATAAGAAAAAPAAGLAQAAVQPRVAGAVPSAPAGMAGPALASATKAIPDPEQAGAPDDTLFVPAAAAGNGRSAGEHTAVLAPAGGAAATPAAAAASARAASASPRPAAAAPPRMQIGAEQDAPAPPAAPAAASGASRVRRIGGHPEPAAVALPAFDDDSVGGGRFSGAMLPLLIAGVAVVVIIAGLIVITNSGGGSPSAPAGNKSSASTTGQALHKQKTTPAPFSAAKVTVAVLNGTAQQGLAGDVGKKLAHDGFKLGNVTNAASQTEASTFVYYVSGGAATKANRVGAQHVATELALPPTRVRHAGSSVIQSCKISATGASLGSCSADVIVSVGQDRVNLASG